MIILHTITHRSSAFGYKNIWNFLRTDGILGCCSWRRKPAPIYSRDRLYFIDEMWFSYDYENPNTALAYRHAFGNYYYCFYLLSPWFHPLLDHCDPVVPVHDVIRLTFGAANVTRERFVDCAFGFQDQPVLNPEMVKISWIFWAKDLSF